MTPSSTGRPAAPRTPSLIRPAAALLLGAAIALVSTPAALALARGDRVVLASPLRLTTAGACSDTAQAALHACRNEAKGDAWHAFAICLNVADAAAREECLAEADAGQREAWEECGEQAAARRELCDALGEGVYDPGIDPADFDDDFTQLTHPNPYFPLGIGHTWRYEGGDETVTVQVLDKTKRIEGVNCVVVNDVEEKNGVLAEDTDDWMAQAKDGTVYYCGELSRDLEFFEGDDPAEAELVDIGGSFKAGRDGAKAGILMLAEPTVGAIYRQEWALGEAEDAAEVLSTTYGYGDDPLLDTLVPQALAELLCDDDCLVTRDFSPLEPDSEERKYYAPGIGLFLEVDVESGEIVQLVGCSFAALCDELP